MVAEGTPESLAGDRAGRAVIAFAPPAPSCPRSRPRRVPGARGVVELHTERLVDDLAMLTRLGAASAGSTSRASTVTRPTLEDIYLELTS